MHRLALGAGTLLGFAALTALFLWLQGGARSAERAGSFTHVHCPECGLEMRYDASQEGASCPRCGPSGPKMIATVGPKREQRAGVGLLGKTLVAMLGASILTLGMLYGWILYSGARHRAEEEASKRPMICHCPFCSRKIGYPARTIGSGAVCPRCKTAFVLPEGAVLEEV
jgi:hypothetical protein